MKEFEGLATFEALYIKHYSIAYFDCVIVLTAL